MIVTATVIDEVTRKVATKRGEREFSEITCLDNDKQFRMKNTFDFTLSEEDLALYKGKLLGKVVTLGIKEIGAGFGGRPNLRGRIVTNGEKA